MRGGLRRILTLSLGLVFTLAVMELGLTLAQWGFVAVQARGASTALQAGQRPYRILCIGEST